MGVDIVIYLHKTSNVVKEPVTIQMENEVLPLQSNKEYIVWEVIFRSRNRDFIETIDNDAHAVSETTGLITLEDVQEMLEDGDLDVETKKELEQLVHAMGDDLDETYDYMISY